jgi:hypothetical protein
VGLPGFARRANDRWPAATDSGSGGSGSKAKTRRRQHPIERVAVMVCLSVSQTRAHDLGLETRGGAQA